MPKVVLFFNLLPYVFFCDVIGVDIHIKQILFSVSVGKKK